MSDECVRRGTPDLSGIEAYAARCGDASGSRRRTQRLSSPSLASPNYLRTESETRPYAVIGTNRRPAFMESTPACHKEGRRLELEALWPWGSVSWRTCWSRVVECMKYRLLAAYLFIFRGHVTIGSARIDSVRESAASRTPSLLVVQHHPRLLCRSSESDLLAR